MRAKLMNAAFDIFVKPLANLLVVCLTPCLEWLCLRILERRALSLFSEVDDIFVAGPYRDTGEIADSRVFKQFLLRCVLRTESMPSVKDVAAIIFVYGNLPWLKEYRASKYRYMVSDLSFHIAAELNNYLSQATLLRALLCSYKRAALQGIGLTDKSEVDIMLSDRDRVVKQYFSYHEDLSFSFEVAIYIVYERIMTVRVNPARIKEGFFISGFDYYRTDCERWLSFASTTNRTVRIRSYERFHVSGEKLPENSHRIWVM
tara:strand:+ start:432 stop:1211 length:780 start_codon:yes stop_codon:yes gene_type:complete